MLDNILLLLAADFHFHLLYFVFINILYWFSLLITRDNTIPQTFLDIFIN